MISVIVILLSAWLYIQHIHKAVLSQQAQKIVKLPHEAEIKMVDCDADAGMCYVSFILPQNPHPTIWLRRVWDLNSVTNPEDVEYYDLMINDYDKAHLTHRTLSYDPVRKLYIYIVTHHDRE